MPTPAVVVYEYDDASLAADTYIGTIRDLTDPNTDKGVTFTVDFNLSFREGLFLPPYYMLYPLPTGAGYSQVDIRDSSATAIDITPLVGGRTITGISCHVFDGTELAAFVALTPSSGLASYGILRLSFDGTGTLTGSAFHIVAAGDGIYHLATDGQAIDLDAATGRTVFSAIHTAGSNRYAVYGRVTDGGAFAFYSAPFEATTASATLPVKISDDGARAVFGHEGSESTTKRGVLATLSGSSSIDLSTVASYSGGTSSVAWSVDQTTVLLATETNVFVHRFDLTGALVDTINTTALSGGNERVTVVYEYGGKVAVAVDPTLADEFIATYSDAVPAVYNATTTVAGATLDSFARVGLGYIVTGDSFTNGIVFNVATDSVVVLSKIGSGAGAEYAGDATVVFEYDFPAATEFWTRVEGAFA